VWKDCLESQREREREREGGRRRRRRGGTRTSSDGSQTWPQFSSKPRTDARSKEDSIKVEADRINNRAHSKRIAYETGRFRFVPPPAASLRALANLRLRSVASDNSEDCKPRSVARFSRLFRLESVVASQEDIGAIAARGSRTRVALAVCR